MTQSEVIIYLCMGGLGGLVIGRLCSASNMKVPDTCIKSDSFPSWCYLSPEPDNTLRDKMLEDPEFSRIALKEEILIAVTEEVAGVLNNYGFNQGGK